MSIIKHKEEKGQVKRNPDPFHEIFSHLDMFLSFFDKFLLTFRDSLTMMKIKEAAMKPETLNLFVLRLLQTLVVVGIICECLIPVFLPGILSRHSITGGDLHAVLISLMVAGVFAILILAELSRIMKTVVKNACFVKENVRSLHLLGVYAMIIAFLMLLRMVLFPTLTALVILAVFAIAGLFSFVLERVFAQAVSYKEDDDLTI